MMTDVTSLDSGFDAMDGIINSSEAGIHVRVTMPEDPAFQMIFIINPIDLVWTLKQKVLDSVSKDLKDAINYGFYSPPSNNRVGKFLDEERPIKEYPLSVPIGLLEFKYKKKLYKTDLNPLKLKKMHTPSELKIFMELVRKGDIDQLTVKMGRGFDPNFNSIGKGETPLTLAATLPRPGAGILALVGGGAFLDYRSRNGMTPLHVATMHGNKDAVRILLDLGSSPNYKDSKGMTPLCYATTKESPPLCIQWLLQERADIGRCDEKGWMEIHHACEHGLTQHLEQLLYYGADRNAMTRDSMETPLHICARFNQGDCVRLLLLRGADKSLKNKSQQTPEQVARSSGHEAVAKCISDFHPEQVELFADVPKYNEKRRGTISMVTLRNLQRSRSNPNLLQQLFQQDPVLSATVSQAAGVLYISNGLLPNGVKSSSSTARPAASDLFQSGAKGASKIENCEASNRKHIEKIIELHRPPSGFGFILRGPIDPPGSTLKFMPTPEIPARQYIESVDAGSAADKAGLEAGDFILEIGGHNVIFDSHKDCVQLMKNCGDLLNLKVAKVRPIASNSQSEASNSDRNSETQMKIEDSVTSDPTLTPSESKSADVSLASLEVLENLDAGLNSYDDKIAEDHTEHVADDMPPPVEFMSEIHPASENSSPDHNDFLPSPPSPPPPPPPSAYSDSVAEVENADLEVKKVFVRDDEIPSVSSHVSTHNTQLKLPGDSKQYSGAGITRKPLEEKAAVRSKVTEEESKRAEGEGGRKKSTGLAFAAANVAVAKEKIPEEPPRTSTLIKPAKSSDATRVQGQKKYPAPNVPRSSVSTSSNLYSSRVEVAEAESKIYESKLPIPSETSPEEAASVPTPPPPPPPPPAGGVVGTLSRSKPPSESSDRKSASSGVQKQLLEDTRRRDESHAALMAAVMKRKSVLDSTDSHELADSINARVDGTLRLQKTVYRADNTKEVKSPPTTVTLRGTGLLVGPEGTLKRSEPSAAASDGTAGFSAEAEKVRQAFLLRKSTITSKDISGNGEVSPPSVQLHSLTVDRKRMEPSPASGGSGASGGLEVRTLNRTGNRPGSSAVASSQPQPVLADVASIIAQKALERQKKEEANAATMKPEHSRNSIDTGSVPKQADVHKSVPETDGKHGMTSATLPKPSTSRVYTSGGNLKANTGTNGTSSSAKSPPTVNSTLQPKSYRSGVTVVPTSKITSVAVGGSENRASKTVASSVNNGEKAASSIRSPQPGTAVSKQEAGGKAVIPASVIPPPVEFATPAESGFSNDVYATGTLRSVSKSAPSNSMVFRAKGGSAVEPDVARSFQVRPISLWNEKDVGDWLNSLDYSDYCAIFRERKITGNALAQLTAAGMESMGIKNPLHRIRIEKEIHKYKNKK